ncbi:CHC2 zinc finger domain-containing protein [Lutispora sp.]|uniref:CHC2 zinc finger domain-containing protein n=1 Tax=Lutispora sp. TaxID=2828727 RepID=UPI00356A33CE
MSIFETIKASVPIAEAYRKYDGRPLKCSGNRLIGKCSKHNEKTPSLVLYQNSNSGYCFGCSWGFDVIKYVADLYGLSNIEACKKLALDFRIDLPDTQINKKQIKEISCQREENRKLAALLVQRLNQFYNQCTMMFKFFQWAEELFKSKDIEYTDSLYRWIRQGHRFYDRITDQFIEGTFEQQVKLMRNFKNEYFFKLKVGDTR